MSTYRGLTPVQHSVLNVKALVGAFNQEKALVGAFSVITKLRMDLRLKLYNTRSCTPTSWGQGAPLQM